MKAIQSAVLTTILTYFLAQ